MNIYVCIYVYTYMHLHTYICIYIYRSNILELNELLLEKDDSFCGLKSIIGHYTPFRTIMI
jgi:hypothetical protein